MTYIQTLKKNCKNLIDNFVSFEYPFKTWTYNSLFQNYLIFIFDYIKKLIFIKNNVSEQLLTNLMGKKTLQEVEFFIYLNAILANICENFIRKFTLALPKTETKNMNKYL